MPFNLLILACFIYVLLLFMVAFWVERRAVIGQAEWLKSPLVYTLSLSIYCTAWTFYGAVGYASRSGLEFLTIYLGPTLVFVGWLWLLRKLVRIGRLQGVTSIADLISSRFGKSNLLGVIVTLICVVAATPYIALQLQSVTLSFSVLAGTLTKGWEQPDTASIAFWVAVGLAVFTVLFGTRNLDAKEQHPGIVTAIAVEAIVKLIALLAVGIFVVWGMAGGPMDIFERLQRADIAGWEIKPSRWAGLTFLAAAAVITLPRMFQVMVVENDNEKHLATASWAFPLYLMLMSLFVMPIAVMGLDMMPAHANPDLFVLTLPLSQGQNALAMLAFLGGFSSATSMVIVASISLATMVSNHIVMPIWLRLRSSTSQNTDLRGSILLARRCSIAAILAMGYGYYELSGGSSALAAIGLISFMGVAQILPSLLGGIFWRGATKLGAALGLSIGIVIWAYTLFLPSFGPDEALSAAIMFNGPFGLYWLRPQTLFGITGLDPLMHSLFWSFFFNITAFFLGSLLSFPNPVERLQSVAFVNVFEEDVPNPSRWAQGLGEPESLLIMAQRVLGDEVALSFFSAAAGAQGKVGFLPDTTPRFVEQLERRFAGAVGAATAHAMLSQLAGGKSVSVEDLMAVADEAAQNLVYSQRLENNQHELTRATRALREANSKLTQLSVQKDAFLSQVSHELRTPMTSIRAFSEILMTVDLPSETVLKYATIIDTEGARLTRLLDDLLDLSVLQSGAVRLDLQMVKVQDLIERALIAASQTCPERVFLINRNLAYEQIFIKSDGDRLVQVFINLVSNARKYCSAKLPELAISVGQKGGHLMIDFIDNGNGISVEKQELIFEKFARLTDESKAGGAGLGLAICREVLSNLAGRIEYLPGKGGTAFRVTVPLRFPGPKD